MTETRSLRALTQDGQDREQAEAVPSRASRRVLRWLLPIVLLAIAVAAAWQLAGRDAPTYLTEEARTADLQDRVEAAALVAFPPTATAELRSPVGGTLTIVAMKEGDRPASLTTLAKVNDTALVALASPVPLYRDLAEGLQGPDVDALEDALRAAGQDPGADDGSFDAQTVVALRAWQAANGLEETDELPLSNLLWLPPGAQITALNVRLGDPVAPGTPLASVAVPTGLVVQAAIDQADVARVTPGNSVEVELDAFDDPLSGTVDAVALTPNDDSTYQATVRLDPIPDTLRAGMEGTARVLVEVREDVVVVPSGAVETSGPQATVRVLVDGRPQVRRVEVGLVTTEGAEILNGVAPGDAIVVGEQD